MSPIPCPACSRVLPEGAASCPGCHLTLTGPDAARLWQVDQSLAALQRERTVLITALRTQGTGPAVAVASHLATGGGPLPAEPARTPGADTPVADTPVAGAPVAGAPVGDTPVATPPRRTWSTQQTLLAIGVLLVLVAGSIALAIAWFLIGIVGQLLVMAGFTAAATIASLVLSRRRLPSSAEALAVVAGGLLLLDVAAARRFGLGGLDAVDGRTYVAVTGLLAAVALAALHRTDRRVAGFALLSLTAASIGWGGVVAFATHSSGVAALALLGAVGFGTLRLVVPASLGLTRRAATGPATGWTCIAAIAATFGALRAGLDAWSSGASTSHPLAPTDLTADGLFSAVLLGVLTVGGALTTRAVVARRVNRFGSRAAVRADWTTRPLSGDWRALGVLAAVATLAGPTAVLGLALQLGASWSAALAVLAAIAGTALALARTRTTSLGTVWVETQTAAALAVLVLVCAASGSRPALIVALTASALVAATTAVHRPTWRASAAAVGALSTVVAATVGGSLHSETAAVLAAAVTGAVFVALALVRRAEPEEVALAATGHLATLVALLCAQAMGLADGAVIAVLLLIAGTTAATTVLRPPVRTIATAATAVASVWALWLSGGLVGPRTQWAGLALAALGLAALAGWRRPLREEPVLGALSIVVAVGAVGVAVDRSWPDAASVTAAAYGLVALGYAALPHRRAVVAVAVAALTTAVWVELWDADVTTVEAWTLPLAALLLGAGLWSHRELGDRSWLTAGPALVVGLVPSTLLSTVDDGLVRPLSTVAAGVVLLVLGATRRWQALVVVGAAATAVVALTQLLPYAVLLPRYLTLGVLGVALLAVGARYEQRRADARQAVSWLASMS